MNVKACISILLLTSFVGAQELPTVPEFKLEPIPPGPDVLEHVRKGQTAPFEGMLFDPPTALRWGNYIEQARLQTALCYRSWDDLRAIERAYWQGVLEVESSVDTEIRTDLKQRLQRVEAKNTELEVELAQGPKWFESRSFGIVLGFVGGVTLVAFSAWVLNEASD